MDSNPSRPFGPPSPYLRREFLGFQPLPANWATLPKLGEGIYEIATPPDPSGHPPHTWGGNFLDSNPSRPFGPLPVQARGRLSPNLGRAWRPLWDEVVHFVAFGGDVVFGEFGGGGDNGDGFGDFEAESLEASAFGGVVGNQPHFADAEVVEDLGSESVVALVGFESEGFVGFDGVEAAILEFVGAELVDDADAAAFLSDVEDDAGAFGFDHLEGGGKLVTAIAAEGAEDVAGEAGAVDADEGGVGGDVAFDDGDERLGFDFSFVGVDGELAEFGGEVDRAGFAGDEGFGASSVGDQIFDGDDFEIVFGGVGFETTIEAEHFAIVADDFDADSDGFAVAEEAEVNGCFGVSGAAENATFFGAEDKHVSGAHEVGGEGLRVADDFNGFGAVSSGDSGGGAFDGVDSFGHGGSESGGVGFGHHGDAELVESFFGNRNERDASAFFDHEVHVGGGDMFAEHDEIAFIFSGGIIDDDDHFPGFEVFEGFLD